MRYNINDLYEELNSNYNKLRFWSKVDIKEENDCWEWQAFRDKCGYGQFGIKYQIEKSHRISYLLINEAIPEGMNILHKCDNPPCCNPIHLFAGTQFDNIKNMASKGRNSCLKLNDEDVLEIVKLIEETTLTQQQIADKFGVNHRLISSIQNGVAWRHLFKDRDSLVENMRRKKIKERNQEMILLDGTGEFTKEELSILFSVNLASVYKIIKRGH